MHAELNTSRGREDVANDLTKEIGPMGKSERLKAALCASRLW